MREFIVWNNNKKIFIENKNKIHIDFSQNFTNGYVISEVFDYDEIEIDGLIFDYIGKKDINNKKIYVDSSIIEFQRGDNIFYAYFSFDKNYLRYDVCIFACNNIEVMEIEKTEFFYWSDAKFLIVDTLQENKLKLIK